MAYIARTIEPLIQRSLKLFPVIVFTVLTLFNPHFFDPMTAEGSAGRAILIGAAISVIVGYMIMMKIADVDV